MAALSSSSHISLARTRSSLSLSIHEWLEVRDGLQAWSGQVRVQLRDHGELEHFARVVHACCLDIHGETRELELHSAFLGQGNGAGAVIAEAPPLP